MLRIKKSGDISGLLRNDKRKKAGNTDYVRSKNVKRISDYTKSITELVDIYNFE